MVDIIRQDDPGDHQGKFPGKVLLATGSATLNGKKVAVHGDLYKCSKHGPVPIIATGSGTIDGKKIAKVGDKASCGAALKIGSSDGSID